MDPKKAKCFARAQTQQTKAAVQGAEVEGAVATAGQEER